MTINLDGDTVMPDSKTQLFSGGGNLLMTVRILKLAAKLDIEVIEETGRNWVVFELNGERLIDVSFYDPAQAYAFLLGFAASVKCSGSKA